MIFDGCSPDAAKVIKRRADELASPAFMLEEFMYEVVSNTPEGIRFLWR